jgi:diguanylate cyclase (GGDEF)-like protein
LGRAPRRTHDEIDLVVAGFGILQDGIRAHIDSLDRQVAERTRELESALESIRRLSALDGLTGCFNRATFNERAPQEIERAERYGRPLAIVFVDLDHFKRINDFCGHLAGDEVLRAAADRFRHGLRQVDWIARYGGEEFVIVLPEATIAQARALAHRLLAAIRAPLVLADGRVLQVTASFGLAERAPGESLAAWLDRADRHLFEAKAAGRDTVRPQDEDET